MIAYLLEPQESFQSQTYKGCYLLTEIHLTFSSDPGSHLYINFQLVLP